MASSRPPETPSLTPRPEAEETPRVLSGATEATAAVAMAQGLPPPPDYFAGDCPPPPAYQIAAELPTYEEAERTKGKYMSGEDPAMPQSPGQHSNLSNLTMLTLSSAEAGGGGHAGRQLDLEDVALLGNDFVFFTAFLTAFLFNWIGFLLLMCFCHTIAARYGALSGFGLSLTKWTLIVKRSSELSSQDNSWLWWLIIGFGLLICVRATVQYLHIKRVWPGLSTAARERLFFFY